MHQNTTLIAFGFALLFVVCGENNGGAPAGHPDANLDVAHDDTTAADLVGADVAPDVGFDSDLTEEVIEPIEDRDQDGVPDEDDLFPDDPCEATDLDGDGIGDAADPDRDGDGVDDRWERRIGTNPNDSGDFPDETDRDGDLVPDYRDPFPDDTERSEDLDGDGLADDEDPDDDNDGLSDEQEVAEATDPFGLIPHDTCARAHELRWYAGDFHSHTTYSDGHEDMPDWVAIHEYYEDPRFLDWHPEYEGRRLDFQTLTDHRTIEGTFDPAFHSDRLALIPGQEIGGGEHSNGSNLLTRIDHSLRAGETYDQRMASVLEQIHWQAGLFQVNHPTSPDIMWTTPTDEMDAIEVWNSPWAVQRSGTEADLDSEATGRGEENPYIRPAIRRVSTSANGQALAMWELMLTSNQIIPAIGGSDRHMAFAPGHPTTWVLAERLTPQDILDGVRSHRTIITRHPAAVRIDVGLRGDAADDWAVVGDELILPTDSEVEVRVVVEYGAGGIIQIVGGTILENPTREELFDAPLGEVLLEHNIPEDADDPYVWSGSVTPSIPGWIYVRALEPIVLDGLSEDSVEKLEDILEVMRVGMEDPFDLITLLAPVLADADLLGLQPCTEESWTAAEELNVECFLVDQTQLYTFLLPEPVDRILNYWLDPRLDGDFALGAMTSAFVLHTPRP